MRRVDKPWGYELIWAHTERYVGKILHINAGESLSLQYHRQKEETLYLQSGRMTVEIAREGEPLRPHPMGPGDVLHITPGLRHRPIVHHNRRSVRATRGYPHPRWGRVVRR